MFTSITTSAAPLAAPDGRSSGPGRSTGLGTPERTCWSVGEPVGAWASAARVPHWRTGPPSPVRERMVIVAPRPGDETLACAGLMLWCAHHGVAVTVAALSDGEADLVHGDGVPASGVLASRRTRVAERDAALAALGVRASVRRFGWPEHALADADDDLATRLASLLDDRTVCVAPWQLDGPPEHRAAARAAATAAVLTGARLWEAPLWGRLDGRFDLSPSGRDAHALDLGPVLRARKQAAVATFHRPLAPRGRTTVHSTVEVGRAVQALTTSVEWFCCE